jgi:TPP-dependent indolepyruvate ferredoxin oxidoreductase alpha subunit
MELKPGGSALRVSFDQVKVVGLNVHRDHVLGIELDHIEGGVLMVVGGQ